AEKPLRNLDDLEPLLHRQAETDILAGRLAPKHRSLWEATYQGRCRFTYHEVRRQGTHGGLQLQRMHLTVTFDQLDTSDHTRNLRIALENRQRPGKKARSVFVIGVQKAHILAQRMPQAQVARRRRPRVPRLLKQADIGKLLRQSP